jgi:hypothetical protein
MSSFQSTLMQLRVLPKPDDENSHFLMIVDGSRAGGRNWSSLKGKVICDTCYEQ